MEKEDTLKELLSPQEISSMTKKILSYIDGCMEELSQKSFSNPVEKMLYLAKHGFASLSDDIFKLVNPNEDLSLIEKARYSKEALIDVNLSDEEGDTLLHYLATKHYRCPLSEYLLAKGADANLLNQKGETPLKKNAFRLNGYAYDLIQATSLENLNKVYPDGETILTTFVQKGCSCKLEEMTFVLQKAGVDLNQVNLKGHTPLYYLANRLIESEKEGDVNSNLQQAFLFFVENGALFTREEVLELDIFNSLKEKGILLLGVPSNEFKNEYDQLGNSPLHRMIISEAFKQPYCDLKDSKGRDLTFKLVDKCLEMASVNAKNNYLILPMDLLVKKGEVNSPLGEYLREKGGKSSDERANDLAQQLADAKGDKDLENLIFRYYQGLELGNSHFRESMYLGRFSSPEALLEEMYENRSKSKRQLEEERLAKENPGKDACQLYLERKYGRRRDDFF